MDSSVGEGLVWVFGFFEFTVVFSYLRFSRIEVEKRFVDFFVFRVFVVFSRYRRFRAVVFSGIVLGIGIVT